MSGKTPIEWTENSWNPVVGCTKVSPGCALCYAERDSKRHTAKGTRGYKNGFTHVSLMPHRLYDPMQNKTPAVYFVPSMGDLFHDKVPFDYIDRVMAVMKLTPHHTYQLLTKRAERMREYFSTRKVPFNCAVGVSVENRKHGLPRIAELQQIVAESRFLSCEPLLGDLGKLDLSGIHTAIVGGETGKLARRMKEEWVHNIKVQCDRDGVAFHFKQWGSIGRDGIKRQKKRNGRIYRGKTWDTKPGVLEIIATDRDDAA